MKYVDDFRNPATATEYVRAITSLSTKRWTIMEVCGGQTHAIVRNGIDRQLTDTVILLHGPGCPVCVTPTDLIDKAIELASRENVIFCSFGDMLRVPGHEQDLLSVKAKGAEIRTLYSPLDCLEIAQHNPDKQVVFFAIGFETTAPVNASVVYQAHQKGLHNFSILCAQVLIPPAIAAILESPECRVQALLAPGHVCSVTGCGEYEQLATRYRLPIIITGFEPVDILQGIYMAVAQLEHEQARLENQYTRAVRSEGNKEARYLMSRVFHVVDRTWRGLGVIPSSGLALRDEFTEFDAEKRFELTSRQVEDNSQCISGLILQGIKKPCDCPAFGGDCTPERPLGATMVSSEGACAAYFRYHGSGNLTR
ncbi:MAG: hydrogenase formation protein HypD [Candidatus Zixiibacteriota bacterium]|nr:MAG: hydrogenase formation protein HypD [candidate division Zixibacteria bacterium]